MFDPESVRAIRRAIREQTRLDLPLLDELRADMRALAGTVRVIRPRSATAVSLVASDGGNNRLTFDPFAIQVVRVVDSYGKELFCDAVSPTTDTDTLSRAQFDASGAPATPLGRLMADLGTPSLCELSPMIPSGEKVRKSPEQISPSWVLVYRDLCEWAVLYERICTANFGTDTLFVRDGILRAPIFRGDLLMVLGERLEQAMRRNLREERRHLFLVGLAKHSHVLTRYRLAMALERTLPAGEPRYVRIPRELEAKTYRWPEYTRGIEASDGGAKPQHVLGDMYLVRFGTRALDPVWTVDVFTPQSAQTPEILGYLLGDAIGGFPVPFYPRCLQRAHEHAQVVDFDLEILQDEVCAAVRGLLPAEQTDAFDAVRLSPDLAALRYG